MAGSNSVIDLSRLPAPEIIESLDYEALRAAYWDRLLAAAPQFSNARALEQSPINMVLGSQAYGELILRARINAAARAVLAPLATGSNLDNVVARINISRLVLVPAEGSTPAVMESDDHLLARYLLAFDRPSAGSADRYIYEAMTAWPQMLDAAVLGFAVHGRRGDLDIVVAGPGGRLPTETELATVRAAVTASNVRPEAVSVTVIAAQRTEYAVSLRVKVMKGPDPVLVKQEIINRVRAVATDRAYIGAEAPMDLLAGAGYGPGVLRVDMDSPSQDVAANPYKIPVCTDISVILEVAA